MELKHAYLKFKFSLYRSWKRSIESRQRFLGWFCVDKRIYSECSGTGILAVEVSATSCLDKIKTASQNRKEKKIVYTTT
jgi:hypothetical protein